MGVIVLQRGHVPRTTGATGASGEQAYAIAAAAATAAKLHALGHVARIVDADIPDSYYRGDMFFALHWDGSTNPTASGASVGYQSPEGEVVARAWKRHYKQNGWTRAFRQDNYSAALGGYYGVRRAIGVGNRRAIITEAGFITNAHDAAMMSAELTAMAISATVVEILGGCPPGEQPAGLPPYPGTVRMGDRGEAVAAWQRQLVKRGYTIAIDGNFGPATNHVVVHWQSTHNLVADGIAGPATWHSLLFG